MTCTWFELIVTMVGFALLPAVILFGCFAWVSFCYRLFSGEWWGLAFCLSPVLIAFGVGMGLTVCGVM